MMLIPVCMCVLMPCGGSVCSIRDLSSCCAPSALHSLCTWLCTHLTDWGEMWVYTVVPSTESAMVSFLAGSLCPETPVLKDAFLWGQLPCTCEAKVAGASLLRLKGEGAFAGMGVGEGVTELLQITYEAGQASSVCDGCTARDAAACCHMVCSCGPARLLVAMQV